MQRVLLRLLRRSTARGGLVRGPARLVRVASRVVPVVQQRALVSTWCGSRCAPWRRCGVSVRLASSAAGAPQVLREMDPMLYKETTTDVFDCVQDRLEEDDVVSATEGKDFDLDVADGVMSVKCEQGTWVMNTHNASKQIWLSSPISGPHKFYYGENERWVDERDDELLLFDLLSSEFAEALAVDGLTFDEEF